MDIKDCAYKDRNQLTAEELHLWEVERLKCQMSFVHFLDYVRLILPPMPNRPGGVFPILRWPHTMETIYHFLTDTLISIYKSRQIGISTIAAAYVIWLATTKFGSRILLFSKAEPEAQELLGKARNIYDYLPGFLKVNKLDPESTIQLGFPELKSMIKAFPSTTSAGIGETANLVVSDEHAEHPYAESNYKNVKPTIDTSGGQFISIWTAPTHDLDNFAVNLWLGAQKGENDFVPLFFPWDVVPGRDDAWYERTKRNIPKQLLGTMSPELYMRKNYPKVPADGLKPAEEEAVFDVDILDQMKEECKPPIKVERDGIDTKICNIYISPFVGVPYIAASDCGEGLGHDYSVTGIMNSRTGQVVADIFANNLSVEEFAKWSVRLLEIYDSPKWFPENNNQGILLVSKAQDEGYKNFGYQNEKETKDGLKKTKAGFNTHSYITSTGLKGSRMDLFGELITAINNHQITIYNLKGLLQFYDIIRNVKDRGKIEAIKGKHDDYPIMTGICWLKRNEAKVKVTKPKVLETLTFSNRAGSLY